MIRRSWLLLAALLGVSATASAQTTTTVRVAYAANEGAAQVMYAQDEGFFTKEGLNVELQAMTVPAVYQAVIGGASDIGFGAIAAVAIAHSKDVPFVFVAAGSYAVDPKARRTGGLLVAATSNIQRAKDLDGTTLCTPGINTLIQFAERAWLDANGGDSATVKFVEVPFSTTRDAILAGRCAAGFLTEPFYTAAKPDTRTLAFMLDAISPNYLGTGWFAMQPWAHEHADAARRFAAAMRDASAWANRFPPAIPAILAKYTGVDAKTIATGVRVTFAERLTPEIVQPSIDATAHYMHFPAFAASALFASP